jgi:hypothetical protein
MIGSRVRGYSFPSVPLPSGSPATSLAPAAPRSAIGLHRQVVRQAGTPGNAGAPAANPSEGSTGLGALPIPGSETAGFIHDNLWRARTASAAGTRHWPACVTNTAMDRPPAGRAR